MSKKKTKKLRRAIVEQLEDWLEELTPEQLAQVRVTARTFKPSFRAVLEKVQTASEGIQSVENTAESAGKRSQ